MNQFVEAAYKSSYQTGRQARERIDQNPSYVYASKIIGVVCGYFQIEMRILSSKSRTSDKVYARQVCMYFLREFSDLTLKSIGELFGRDHTTAMYSCETVASLKFSSPQTRVDVKTLEILIKEIEKTEA